MISRRRSRAAKGRMEGARNKEAGKEGAERKECPCQSLDRHVFEWLACVRLSPAYVYAWMCAIVWEQRVQGEAIYRSCLTSPVLPGTQRHHGYPSRQSCASQRCVTAHPRLAPAASLCSSWHPAWTGFRDLPLMESKSLCDQRDKPTIPIQTENAVLHASRDSQTCHHCVDKRNDVFGEK